MRFSLIDLLIAIGIVALGMTLVMVAGQWMGVGRPWRALELPLGMSLGLLLYLLITPPVYRWLHLYPLLLPVCPHCRRRPGLYRFVERAPPRFVVACGACEREIEWWLERPANGDVSTTMPSLLWSWPHSIGRWRLISRGG
jgi:hypothetical protein